MWSRLSVVCLSALFLLSGCKARIQHGLDERQANELQTVLLERGLSAAKVAEEGKKPTWAIEVDDEQAADAVRILAELGLPRAKSEGFGDIFGKGSLVPTPTEERALYLQALSGELARTLESVEGVVSARVHLVLAPTPKPGQLAVPSKASAFIKVRPGAFVRVNSFRDELRDLIAGSVEGLNSDSVTLVVNEVSTQVSAPDPAPSPVPRLRALLLGLAGVLVILAVAVVVLMFRLRKQRQLAEAARRTPPKIVITPNAAKRVA
ncbi:MAG: type III secretion system inner membrane ring lipoprotein SctJ [Myxococcaceae bacterium]